MTKNTSVSFCSVSSYKVEDKDLAITSQVQCLQNYADNKELTIAKTFISTDGDKRELINEMFDFIARNKINNILVCRFENLSRNHKDLCLFNEWLGKGANRELHIVCQEVTLIAEIESYIELTRQTLRYKQ